MTIIKEYRICMPLTVDEYHIGQLYMINKHSHEQSEKGEGVEVVANEECEDPVHGKGRFTEKRVYLNSKLPTWIQGYVPKIFYITEKAWNYYPYTVTEYSCSFLPRFSILVKTGYKNDNGCTENALNLVDEEVESREVLSLDIAYDEVAEKYYKKEEDLTTFKSKKTERGPLQEGWRLTDKPIMCSYKLVNVEFNIWGLGHRVESYVHSAVKDILLVGHRQAFAWIDQWYDMTIDDVRAFEKEIQEQTNIKVLGVDDKKKEDEQQKISDESCSAIHDQ